MTLASVANFDIVRAFMNLASLGAAWVMWLLVAVSVILAAIILERSCLFTRTRVDAPKMGRAILECLESGDIAQAQSLVARGVAMEERILADALEAWHRGSRAVEQIMRSSLERERQRFERHLSTLGTVGSNAPFVGLFGTVIGIILAFRQLATHPKGGMAVVGPGLAEALVSTAVGLLVAIPAVVAFNCFRNALAKRISNAEFLSGIVLSLLPERTK